MCIIRLARLTGVQEVPGSIPGYTLENFWKYMAWYGVQQASWGELGSYMNEKSRNPVKKAEIEVEG